jgi:hypothetical protein
VTESGGTGHAAHDAAVVNSDVRHLTDLAQDLEKQARISGRLNRYVWMHTVKPLVTPTLIDEHRQSPLGKHSPALDMVLHFLRRDLVKDRPRLLVVIMTPEAEWAVGEHWRTHGPSIRVRPKLFRDKGEVEHAIFLERLAEVQRFFG